MIFTSLKKPFEKLVEPLILLLIRLKVSPNMVTAGTLALIAFWCLVLFFTKNVSFFAWAVFLTGLLDAVDGAIARRTGASTKFGSYFDAMSDRFVEVMVVLSAAYMRGEWLLNMIFISGALITSYAKARAGMEVPISNTEWPEYVQRTERCSLYLLGLFLSEILTVQPGGKSLYFWTLLILSVAAYFSVGQRLFRAKKIIESR